MDMTAITAYLLGKADQNATAAATAYQRGDQQQATTHADASQVYDEAAARLMAIAARSGN